MEELRGGVVCYSTVSLSYKKTVTYVYTKNNPYGLLYKLFYGLIIRIIVQIILWVNFKDYSTYVYTYVTGFLYDRVNGRIFF